jgi:hypothetical protein
MLWEKVELFVSTYMIETMLILATLTLALLITCAVFFVITVSLKRRYNRLMIGSGGVNLEELLNHYGSLISKGLEQQQKTEIRLKEAEQRLQVSLAGVGLVRYNAFRETGSDLSFSLALLDRNQNGVVLTSIYGREESRCYGKPILNGESAHFLSEEETQALVEARVRLR